MWICLKISEIIIPVVVEKYLKRGSFSGAYTYHPESFGKAHFYRDPCLNNVRLR